MTTHKSGNGFWFRIPDLSDRESAVVEVFLQRAIEFATQQDRQLDIDEDGLPILGELIDEMLPDYSLGRATDFAVKVLGELENALALKHEPPRGSA